MADQNLSAKKSDAMSEGVRLARQILVTVADAAEWVQNLTSNGFQQGGANAIVQNDIVGENVHLTPALVQQLRTAANAMLASLNDGQKDNLRQAAKQMVRVSRE